MVDQEIDGKSKMIRAMILYCPQGGRQKPNAQTHPRLECGEADAEATAMTHVRRWVKCMVSLNKSDKQERGEVKRDSYGKTAVSEAERME